MSSVTFRVNLCAPVNYPALLPQDQIAMQRSVWVPIINKMLKHGDTFTLQGEQAYYMRNIIRQVMGLNGQQSEFVIEIIGEPAEEIEEEVTTLSNLFCLTANNFVRFSTFPMTLIDDEALIFKSLTATLVDEEEEYTDLLGACNTDDGLNYFLGVKNDEATLSFFKYNFATQEKTVISIESDAPPGNYIDDGGSDMYDNGNYLNTNLATEFQYTHSPNNDNGEINTDGDVFGEGSSFFTNKYPYLFAMVAQNMSITEFSVTGGLGADGSGQTLYDQTTITVSGNPYTVFYKKVWDTSDPSVNHIIILPGNSVAEHEASNDTNEDYDKVFSITENKLAYLLFAVSLGGEVTEETFESVASEFISTTGFGTASISSVLSALSSNHGDITSLITDRYDFSEDTGDDMEVDGFTYIGDNEFAAIINDSYWRINSDGEISVQSVDNENFSLSSILVHSNNTLYAIGNGKTLLVIDKDTGEITNEEGKKVSYTWVDGPDLGPVEYLFAAGTIGDKAYAALETEYNRAFAEINLEELTLRYISSVYDNFESFFPVSSEAETNNGIGFGIDIADSSDDFATIESVIEEGDGLEGGSGYFLLEKSLFHTEPTTSNITVEYGLFDEESVTWDETIITSVSEVQRSEEAPEGLTMYKFEYTVPTDDGYSLRLYYNGSDYKVYIGD